MPWNVPSDGHASPQIPSTRPPHDCAAETEQRHRERAQSIHPPTCPPATQIIVESSERSDQARLAGYRVGEVRSGIGIEEAIEARAAAGEHDLGGAVRGFGSVDFDLPETEARVACTRFRGELGGRQATSPDCHGQRSRAEDPVQLTAKDDSAARDANHQDVERQTHAAPQVDLE